MEAIRLIDPHVHGQASGCSSIADDALLEWFLDRPHQAVVVSDHASWDFYQADWAKDFAGRTLYATEITMEGTPFDFLLHTWVEGLFEEYREELLGRGRRRVPPLAVLEDSRVLVTFAHPPLDTPARRVRWPGWFGRMRIDFLEFNAVRLRALLGRLAVSREPEELRKAVQTVNGRMLELRGHLAPEAKFSTGSDAHVVQALGAAGLALETPAPDGETAWRELQAGRYRGWLDLRRLGNYAIDPVSGLQPKPSAAPTASTSPPALGVVSIRPSAGERLDDD